VAVHPKMRKYRFRFWEKGTANGPWKKVKVDGEQLGRCVILVPEH